MKTIRGLIQLLIFPAWIAGCVHTYQASTLQFAEYRITPALSQDSVIKAFLKPYADTINELLDVPLVMTKSALVKKQPEGTLGNLFADACREMASEKFGVKVDVAFVNYGGIRIPEVPPGPVTKKKVYEIMPFENKLLLQHLKGEVLKRILDFTAERGGWPVSGLRMKIRDRKAVEVMIGGKPIDITAYYYVVNSDYILNGGDRLDFLKEIPSEDRNYLMRDALIDYLTKLKEANLILDLKEDGRIQYVK